MSIIKEIHVPDIGDFKGVDVIDVLVAAGDSVDVEQPLIIGKPTRRPWRCLPHWPAWFGKSRSRLAARSRRAT